MPLVREYVDRLVTVEEDDIAAAILVLLEREKTLAEGAGAIGLAALLQGLTGHRGKRIGVVISGGNLDVNILSRIIERGMVRDGRRLRLRITLPDYPGALEGLARRIADANANIVETLHNRAHYGVSLSETAIDITMETRGQEHVEEIAATLTAGGYSFHRVE
jgi:threonine dehydratase